MFILLEVTKETKTSLFFEAQHKELDTLHTIEVEKDEIQNALERSGQNPIPSHKIDNIRHYDCVCDVCQDIVSYSKEYFVLEGGVSKSRPTWNTDKMYHNAGRFNVSELEIKNPNFYPKRGELLIDGVIVKGFSARVK